MVAHEKSQPVVKGPQVTLQVEGGDEGAVAVVTRVPVDQLCVGMLQEPEPLKMQPEWLQGIALVNLEVSLEVAREVEVHAFFTYLGNENNI